MMPAAFFFCGSRVIAKKDHHSTVVVNGRPARSFLSEDTCQVARIALC